MRVQGIYPRCRANASLGPDLLNTLGEVLHFRAGAKTVDTLVVKQDHLVQLKSLLWLFTFTIPLFSSFFDLYIQAHALDHEMCKAFPLRPTVPTS